MWSGNTEVEPGSVAGLILSTSTVRGSPQVELMRVCSIWLALLHLVKVPCNRRPDTFGKGHCSYCDYEASHWRTRKFWIPRVVVEPINVLRICPWCWLTWIEVGIYGYFSKCHSAFSSYASPRGILPRRILWGSTTDCSHSDTPTTSFNVAVETLVRKYARDDTDQLRPSRSSSLNIGIQSLDYIIHTCG